MSWSKAALLLLPLLPALAGTLPLSRARSAGKVGIAATALATALAGYACVSAFLAVHPTTARWELAPGSPLSLGLRLDRLSAVVALLITMLGCCVLRFSERYLAGDARQVRFLRRVCLLLGAVLGFCLAGDLLTMLGAWTATSLLLHGLLTHYPERQAAIRAAKNKFVMSRLAEGAVLTALVLLSSRFGTLELDALFAAASRATADSLTLPALLLVGAALVKSAQLPFHSWLPDTMETPTPVSALMHAGIINAGGFLMIRLSPLVSRVPVAMQVLALAGALTAAFAALVMLTQPSVKRSLAYSTIAQMGFMLLECGLGLTSLALLHIVAHSIYKAAAFMRAGSAVTAAPRSLVPLRTAPIFGALSVALGLVFGISHLWSAEHTASATVMRVVLSLSLAYGLARHWAVSHGVYAGAGLVAAAVFALLATSLHELSTDLVTTPGGGAVGPGLATALCGLFVALFILQVSLWRISSTALGRALYVHALNGFYVSALTTRLLQRCWPSRHVETPHPVELPLTQRG